MTQDNRAPRPGDLLFDGLFKGRTVRDALVQICLGIDSVIENGSELLEDAKILASNDRFARASFLLATAREEFAKIHILIDLCRLDFVKHREKAKRLCIVFYSHVRKHAYCEAAKLFRLQHNQDMAQLNHIWHQATIGWFPAGEESGEPDFPHDTVFNRQFPLYVDYDLYSMRWMRPSNETYRQKFSFGLPRCKLDLENPPTGLAIISDYAQLHRDTQSLLKARALGMFSIENLSIVHSICKTRYIQDKTSPNEVWCMQKKLFTELAKASSITTAQFEASPLWIWPLYAFA